MISENITFTDYLTSFKEEDTIQDIISGLLATPKHICSKYLYDDTGSQLFRKITQLPEYYLSRLERELIKTASEKLQLSNTDIIELGSGDCSKISLFSTKLV